jgi:CHRD domain-containing protein
MNSSTLSRSAIRLLVLFGSALVMSCATGPMSPQSTTLSFSPGQEVPPTVSTATGAGQITVNPDRSVSGSVSVFGMTPTAAHIHDGAPGTNGPVVIGLTKTSDTTFTLPAGSILTEAQYATLRAGNYYVNVHSAAYPDGEIRAQIKVPPSGS